MPAGSTTARYDAIIRRLGQRLGLFIEPLPQPRRGGHPADAQRPLEERVVAHPFHGLEVVLALTQQPQVGADQINVGYAMTKGNRLQARLETTVSVDDGTDHRQADVRGIDFRIALLENEGHRNVHPW